MATVTLNQVLELAGALPADDQDLLLKVLRRRRAEAWCEELAADARKAEHDFRGGKLKIEPHETMKARLRATLGPMDE
jgi:hypothetical protein